MIKISAEILKNLKKNNRSERSVHRSEIQKIFLNLIFTLDNLSNDTTYNPVG